MSSDDRRRPGEVLRKADFERLYPLKNGASASAYKDRDPAIEYLVLGDGFDLWRLPSEPSSENQRAPHLAATPGSRNPWRALQSEKALRDYKRHLETLLIDADDSGVPIPFLEWLRNNRCSPEERLLDVHFEGVSMMELGSELKDEFRRQDSFVLERLVRASRWRQPIGIDKLAESVLDPSQFVFADAVAKGREEISAAVITNTIKRIRQTFDAAGGVGDELITGGRGRGYLFDFARCAVCVIHIRQ